MLSYRAGLGFHKGWAQSCLRNEEEKLAGCEYLFRLNTSHGLADVQAAEWRMCSNVIRPSV